ncbi:hypothetical protein COR50_16245 [Chitinophaga caeni]|uniref:Uncharacterized protein n=1 Tax=Chitinophaga caeni TaxID=2029983 RepID=A0A291QXA5_9BACT|nr:hypothetical protein [Chitinophaga caeni]ATL48588.1 hypothetical protein COR50_16245 [Chitinophaga caeni]
MLGIECLLLIPFATSYTLFNRAQKAIFYYLVVSVILGLGSYIIAIVLRQNNMWFVPILQVLQFLSLTIFYYSVIKNPHVKKFILLIFFAGAVIFLIDYMKISNFKGFLSIFESFRTFMLILYGIIFFLQLLKDEKLIEQAIYINSLPNFWFNAGLFLYLCCYFLMSMGYSLMQKTGTPKEEIHAFQQFITPIHYTSGILQLILFYIGLRKIKPVKS